LELVSIRNFGLI